MCQPLEGRANRVRREFSPQLGRVARGVHEILVLNSPGRQDLLRNLGFPAVPRAYNVALRFPG